MARSLRFQYPGAYYHVLGRGNRRQAIFLSDEDHASFLRTLGDACDSIRGITSGDDCLAIATRLPVEGYGYYYETLLDYVHLNPARAGLVKPREGGTILDYAWSSVAAGYALAPRRRPQWLAAEAGLAAFGFSDTTGGRRAFVERLDDRALEEPKKAAGVPLVEEGVDRRRSDLRRGWYWGSQEFAERLLGIGQGTLALVRQRQSRRSPEHRAHGEAEAQRILQEGLSRLGWTRVDLECRHGSESSKVELAARIFGETTVS